MLTTHNFKLLNPDVQQLPLCGQLSGKIPLNVICSKNIKLRHYLWRDPLQFRNDNINDSLLSDLNNQFKTTGKLPEYVNRTTDLMDQRMHHLYLNLGAKSTGENICAITPAPCDGIFHEIIARSEERFDSHLSKQQIEVKADRMSMHGPMVALHQGSLQVFALPRFEPQPIRTAPVDKKYIVLEFGVFNFNVATGMMGIGLPAVTVFGTMLSNFVAKACGAENELRFAIGLHSASSRQRNNGLILAGSHSNNHLRKSNLQGYLVIEPESEEQAERIFTILSGSLKISGTVLSHKRVIYTNELPYAYWMKDMGAEVDEFLGFNPHNDVLDAMFDFHAEERLCVPVAVGFSMLSRPKVVDSAVIRQPHCWVETLFKCTELVYGAFKPNYLYGRYYDGDSTFFWNQS